ncbi:TPA: hypothetical protein ACJIKU_000445 [Citrobacter freundii]
MTVYEMEGFLRGKCVPGDMKVNESNAQYLVRKFSEFETKLSESNREFRAADATIHNLELKITDMAVQLANAESKLTKSFPVGVRCIHTSKYEKRRCRVVAYDGEVVVVVKMEGGGYFGVPEKSLTIVKDKPEEAQ